MRVEIQAEDGHLVAKADVMLLEKPRTTARPGSAEGTLQNIDPPDTVREGKYYTLVFNDGRKMPVLTHIARSKTERREEVTFKRTSR